MKRISSMILFSLFFFLVGANLLLAQVDTVLYEQFDNGEGQWATGWIDGANATAAFSIDTTGKLSGKNSYKGVITSAQNEMYRIQRIHDCPLVAGYQYTVSFMAVADSNALVNLLFELQGSPYTKRIDDTVTVTDTAQTFTFTMSATESVPTNQVKFMLGGAQNSGRTIWLDSIIVTRIPDPTLVSEWGRTSEGFGNGWPILNTDSTAAGDASIGGDVVMASGSNGASMLGAFNNLKPTMDSAVVVSGQLKFDGDPGTTNYTALRFALTFLDSATLENQYTDTAKWVTPKKHYGYEFTPKQGTADQPNGSGGVASVWIVNNGNWASTYSNGGGPAPVVVPQAPRNAAMTAGTYNFAISIIQISDTTNEIRWSLVKTDNKYWFAGSVIDTAIIDKFNSIAFWTKNDAGANSTTTKLSVMGVRATLGNPITIPVAPFEPYYVGNWGRTSDGFGAGWPILNDSDYVDGDASIGGDVVMASGSNGASMLGGFDNTTIPTDKALILGGQLEFVGDPGTTNYTALRFALTFLDSATLENQYTDTAKWVSPKKHYGYEFTPKQGTADQPNGSGGVASVWIVDNGNWASTYSNGGGPAAVVAPQAPRNAAMTAGKYNWAVSIQQINDTTNEVRWYLVKTDNKYWFAGTVEVPAVTHELNSIAFWTKNDAGANSTTTKLSVIATKVDMGNPLTLPLPPWEQFYIPVEQWGIYTAGRTGGWKLTTGDVDGNASISGSGPVAANQWAAVRGGFGQTVSFSNLPADTALVVTGKMEFVGGGFDGWSGLRFGVFYSDSAGTIDSTADGPMYNGSEAYSTGYLFCPNSGTNDNPTWSGPGGNGSVGGVVNATWLSTNGANNYIISDQKTGDVSGAGTYNFKLTFEDMGSQGTAVGYSISGPSYLLEGHEMDTSSSRPTKFNAVNFAVESTNSTTTALNLTDVLVDLGSPVITGVSNEKSNTLPMMYSLSQNYPNPFNPTTTIKFGLPKAGDVSLVVYDILGRKVAELVHGNLTAGYHTVNFNASNLASGVYFYRIQAGDFVSVKKLMLLK